MQNFYDLPPEKYPFTIVATNVDTGEVVWEVTASGPGVLAIPGRPAFVREIAITIYYGDGTVEESR